MKTRTALPVLALVALAILAAACSSGGASSSPTPSPSGAAPTPTPIAANVTTPADAATLAIATDPRLAGAAQLQPDMIGGSKWWEAEKLPGGGYRIKVTAGWGDCPAGCISRHAWTFDVTPTGQVTLVEESGDPVPAGSFPPS
ncbi:MAG: hypothetical protein ABIV26_06375 [Candidatus Limnocylindrales bacterium]